MSLQLPQSTSHIRTSSQTSRSNDNQSKLLHKFKIDENKLDHPKALSSYNRVSLQNQVKELEETSHKLQDKMVEFYFFLLGSRMPKGTNIDKEKERYMKIQPMLLFDFMKSFFFKLQNENEDLKTRLTKSSENEQIREILQISKDDESYFQELRKNAENAKFESTRLKSELEKTFAMFNELKASKKNALDTSQVIIMEIQKDNERLLSVIDQKNQSIELLQKDVQDRDKQLNKLKDQVVDSSKLQQKVKILENKYVNDLNQVKVKTHRDNGEKIKEGQLSIKLVAMNSLKDEQIQYLENEVKSFRERINADSKCQGQTQKLVQKADINEKITRKVEQEVARLKIRNEEKDKYIEKLKQEYERVFNELKLYKKEMEKLSKQDVNKLNPNTISPEGTVSNSTIISKVPVELNPYLLQEYKNRVREQEVLITNMRKKFKKMTLAEKKGYIKQKEFEMQKFEYEKQIQELKKNKNNTKLYETDSSVDERGEYHDKVGLAHESQTQWGGGSKTHRSVKSLGQRNDMYMSNLDSLRQLKESKGEFGGELVERIKKQLQTNGVMKPSQSMTRFIKYDKK